mmetsp:Transcript_12293/g.49527  ORF Transcript_12293/g.49527 Transcript_12293/m.49527 type:complete len:229 (+) Transcript_12293:441-1127(+)
MADRSGPRSCVTPAVNSARSAALEVGGEADVLGVVVVVVVGPSAAPIFAAPSLLVCAPTPRFRADPSARLLDEVAAAATRRRSLSARSLARAAEELARSDHQKTWPQPVHSYSATLGSCGSFGGPGPFRSFARSAAARSAATSAIEPLQRTHRVSASASPSCAPAAATTSRNAASVVAVDGTNTCGMLATSRRATSAFDDVTRSRRSRTARATNASDFDDDDDTTPDA